MLSFSLWRNYQCFGGKLEPQFLWNVMVESPFLRNVSDLVAERMEQQQRKEYFLMTNNQ